MEKTILKPGDKLGVITIPKNVFIEIKKSGDRDEEMKIFNMLQILKKEDFKIMCSCEHQEFLWLFERHQRGERRNKEKAFVFKVQITCEKCKRPLSLDIGPTIDCYQNIKKNRTKGLQQWAEEISNAFNKKFMGNH